MEERYTQTHYTKATTVNSQELFQSLKKFPLWIHRVEFCTFTQIWVPIKYMGLKKNHFSLRSETKMPLLLNTVQEILARVIRWEREIKSIEIGKEEVKPSLFAVTWTYI